MITDLRLQHFRSYSDDSFELSPGVNIVVGPNASGKTNLLEAILVLARGSSYRAKDVELVQFNQPWARVDAHLQDSSLRTFKIVNEPVPLKTFEVNDKLYKRLGLAHTLPAVLFEPNHLQLLSGGPEGRRSYLDDLLEQTVAGYGTLRRQYRRTLAQRNALLKKPGHLTSTQLFPWNVRLSQLAGQVVRARTELTRQLADGISDIYRQLSKTETRVELLYASRWAADAYETNMLKTLDGQLETDKQRGFTSAGPHREDLSVLFDDRPAQEIASRGEIRTAVLALKVLELKVIEQARDTTPLLLLDDVFSELDGKRRHALTDYLAPYQTFITTTDADLVLQHFSQHCNVIALT
jgi:DNA replication and repair protein RecF